MPLKTAPTRPKITQAARPLAFAHNLPGRSPLRAAAESTFRVTLDGAARPRSRWLDASTGESATPPVPLTHDPLADLDRLLAAHANPDPAQAFSSGWIGWLSYDLGRWIEPAADGGGCASPARTHRPSSNSTDSPTCDPPTSRDRQGAACAPSTSRDRQGAVLSPRSAPQPDAPPTSPPSSAPSSTSAPATPTR
ncbi:MAG TPA: hypothetical protein PLU35_07145 [Phycisphaerales bacterium]|nr:hypothetical protein [Phycisphaerales bacterium]